MTAAPLPSLRVYGPARIVRVFVYLLAWLPALAIILVFFSGFAPVFLKLKEKNEFSSATRLVMAFTRLNLLTSYILSLIVVVAILAVDEAVVTILQVSGRRGAWAWAWFLFVVVGHLFALGLILFALFEIIDKTTCHLPG